MAMTSLQLVTAISMNENKNIEKSENFMHLERFACTQIPIITVWIPLFMPNTQHTGMNDDNGNISSMLKWLQNENLMICISN